jgi:ribosome-associated heat shock protein Hsp15
VAKYRPTDSRQDKAAGQPGPRPTIRLDKWLWQARFFRARPIACAMIAEGALRVNGNRCLKPGFSIGPGDTLTFLQADRVRVIRVLDIGQRRGPATEAQRLFLDLAPPPSSPACDAEDEDAAGSPLE